jgi:hypothetical protein
VVQSQPLAHQRSPSQACFPIVALIGRKAVG